MTPEAVPEAVVSTRISIDSYRGVVARARRWGMIRTGSGRPNLSAALRRIIRAGLEATDDERPRGGDEKVFIVPEEEER